MSTGKAVILYVSVSAALLMPMAAQTTNFAGTFTTTNTTSVEVLNRGFQGTGAIGALGNGVVSLNLGQQLSEDDYVSGIGPVTPVLTVWVNRLDSVVIGGGQSIPDPNFSTSTLTLGARGTGVFLGLTTTGLTMTLTRTSASPLGYNVSLKGSVTAGGRTTDLSIANAAISQTMTQINVVDNQTGTCSIPGLGQGNLTETDRPDSNSWDTKLKFIEAIDNCSVSATDSIRFFSLVDIDQKTGSPTVRSTVLAGGTGKFAGATGTALVSKIEELPQNVTAVTFSGTITQAGPTTPIITGVNTAYLPLGPITQNDWIEIKGTNLVPKTTPAGGMFWSNAPEFAQGKMPTELGGVSVSVNGKPAYIWWYCSAATTPACASDQINVLTPLDDYNHAVPVVVKNGATASAPLILIKAEPTPSVLLFSGRGDAVATHQDGSIVGPTTLFPGASTPARKGETISLWGVGFGVPTAPLAEGSSTQRGSLPYNPACSVGGTQAQVAAALVSPGLYQLNVTIPATAASGDNPLYCTTPNSWTLPAVIAVQ
jgi:uncharacterized protein (TIGR03437 family)